MTLHRRAFLRQSFATSGLVAYGLTAPTFLARTAQAAPFANEHGARDTILVVVQLTGGNDGLNTVIPYKDAEYAKLRPTLKLPTAQIKKLDDHVGLHPSMNGLADLLQEKAWCVVQGVGYPNPSQSHFRSMDIWQAASLNKPPTNGWLGKALKKLPAAPSFHLKSSGETSPLAFDGAPAKVPSITSIEDYQL